MNLKFTTLFSPYKIVLIKSASLGGLQNLNQVRNPASTRKKKYKNTKEINMKSKTMHEIKKNNKIGSNQGPEMRFLISDDPTVFVVL